MGLLPLNNVMEVRRYLTLTEAKISNINSSIYSEKCESCI